MYIEHTTRVVLAASNVCTLLCMVVIESPSYSEQSLFPAHLSREAESLVQDARLSLLSLTTYSHMCIYNTDNYYGIDCSTVLVQHIALRFPDTYSTCVIIIIIIKLSIHSHN